METFLEGVATKGRTRGEGRGVSSLYMARIHDYLKFLSTIHHEMCR